MRSAYVFALSVLVMISASGCTGWRKAPVTPYEQEPWEHRGKAGVKLITEHFDIYSTLGDEELEEALPGFLEAAHRQYVSLIAPRDDAAPKLQTYVFQTRGEWERFAAERFTRRFPMYRRISAGGFAAGNVCVVYYIKRPYTLSVLAHEGMHQYFANHYAVQLPAWLNEGMATYCESFELPHGQVVFTPKRNSFRTNALREAMVGGTILPLREMLATDAGSVIAKGETVQTKTYYAQAWALMSYLRHGAKGAYADGLAQLLADIRVGDLETMAQAAKIRAPEPAKTSYGEAVFRAYITEDIDAFERGFNDYLYDVSGFKRPKPEAEAAEADVVEAPEG
jgi:hypothetical protein